MSKLTVLHLSDVHWSSKENDAQRTIAQRLVDDLVVMAQREVRPNLVIFSGDLVQAGEDICSFEDAFNSILKPILKHLNLSAANLFVCPGNHDISRKTVREQGIFEAGLKARLTSEDEIDDFVQKAIHGVELEKATLSRMENFYRWHDKRFKGFTEAGPFCRLKTLNVNQKKVGICLFNTAWRATGESGDVDDGHLLLGSIFVEKAANRLLDCDYKIAVLHHPFGIHAEFDRVLTEPRVSKHFDLICTGHTHRPKPERIEDIHGSSIRSQAGSLYAGAQWFNGYQIIEIDFIKDVSRLFCREYFPVTGKFGSASNLTDADPVLFNYSVKVRKDVDEVDQFLLENRSIIKQKLLDHLNFSHDDGLSDDALLDGFACPRLFRKGDGSVDESGNFVDSFKKVKLEELCESSENVLFYGPRQTGKTALKLYCAYKFAFGIGCDPRIPVFIDVRKFNYNLYGLRKTISSAYDIPEKFDLSKAIESGMFLFLFEDVGELTEAELKSLNNFIENFAPNRSFVFGCPDETSLAKERHFRKALTGLVPVGLGEITRSTIRKMANAWFEDSSEARANFDLVVGQMNRDGLPRTAYIVGLLLWAAKQGQQGDRINEAILLQNVLDHLLGRANFETAKRGALNTRGKELLLNKIANCLDKMGGSARAVDVIKWVDEYFDKKKLGHNADEVVSELVSCGILLRENGSIRFRYPCFQEYYIALGMTEQGELERKVEGTKFLARAREVELVSGLLGENDWLINHICEVLEEHMPRDLAGVSFSDFDAETYGAGPVFLPREKLRKIKRTRLTEEQLDQVMDALDDRATARGDRPISETLEETGGDVVEAAHIRQADAVRKDLRENAEFFRPGTYMAGLSILARVLRNSDYTDYDVKAPALNRLLERWCRIHVILSREAKWILGQFEEQEDDPLDPEEFTTLVNIVSKILFEVVGSTVVSELATPALTETINELEREGLLTSGKRVLSLFLLEDADDATWPDKWKSLIEDKSTPGFDIAVLIDRLWRSVNRKALDEEQDRRVIKVVDAIESRYDWENSQKSSVLTDIRGLTNIKRAGED